MNFITHEFIVLFMFFLLLFFGADGKYFLQKIIIIFTNLLFYKSSGVCGIIILLFEAIVTYIGNVLLYKSKYSKIYFYCSIFLCLMPLCIFKYYDFIAVSIIQLLSLIKIEFNSYNFIEHKFIYIA